MCIGTIRAGTAGRTATEPAGQVGREIQQAAQ